jgi:iron complex transport system permease protein
MTLALVLHIAYGSTHIPLSDVWAALFSQEETLHSQIIREIRLLRALSALVAGALLGIVGSAFQAFFRNALADPYVVGVSSGAAVGGALAIVLNVGAAWTGWMSGLGPLFLATVTGLLTLALVMGLSMRRGVLDSATLLLTGVVVSSLLSSLLSLILLWGGQDTNVVLSWLLGHLTPAYWNRLHLMLGVLVIGAPIMILHGKHLNALSLGDEAARRLGVNTRALKPVVLGLGAAMVAVTVGAIGIIGFLGLVSPHIARRLVGVDWRWSLAASGMIGAALLCIADIVAQRIVANAEVPVGIVTAVLGAPFLIALMRRATP